MKWDAAQDVQPHRAWLTCNEKHMTKADGKGVCKLNKSKVKSSVHRQ